MKIFLSRFIQPIQQDKPKRPKNQSVFIIGEHNLRYSDDTVDSKYRNKFLRTPRQGTKGKKD